MAKGHTFRVRPHQVTHSTIQRKFLESVKLPHITDLGKFGGEATVNTIELVVHQGCEWQGVKDFTAVRCWSWSWLSMSICRCRYVGVGVNVGVVIGGEEVEWPHHTTWARTVNGRKREHKREEEVVRKQQKMKGGLKRDGFCGFVGLVWMRGMDGWIDGLTRVSRPRLHSCQTCWDTPHRTHMSWSPVCSHDSPSARRCHWGGEPWGTAAASWSPLHDSLGQHSPLRMKKERKKKERRKKEEGVKRESSQ